RTRSRPDAEPPPELRSPVWPHEQKTHGILFTRQAGTPLLCLVQHRPVCGTAGVVGIRISHAAGTLGAATAAHQRYPAAGSSYLPCGGQSPVPVAAALAHGKAHCTGALYRVGHDGDSPRQVVATACSLRAVGHCCLLLHLCCCRYPLSPAL